jgi:hypothetical protein
MTRIFVDYVPDKVIVRELKQFHAYEEALRNGIAKNERPALPRPPKARTSKSLLGAILYLTSCLLLSPSRMLGMVKAQEWLARNRIGTDEYSSEPMSCGIHNAYTEYGLARLTQGDVTLAIQSMIYSIKIHPCHHTVTYGLSYALRNKLKSYTEAEEAIRLFDEVARRYSGQEWYRHQDDS